MFRRLFGLLGSPRPGTLETAPPASPAPLDPRALFADEVTAVLQGHPDVAAIAPVEGSFAFDVTLKDGRTSRLFLDNHFAETREMSPDDRRARLLFAFAAIKAPDEAPWDAAREELLLVIRGVGFGSLSPKDLPAGATKPVRDLSLVRRSFLPFLDVLVVRDTPTTMAFVPRSTLETWNVENDEVLAAAQARVVSTLGDPPVALYDELHGPLWIVASEDTYESSRLLLPGWLASFRGRVEGRPLAIVPERGMLLVGGDQRSEMIERLVTMAEKEFQASSRRISCGVYTVDDAGQVIPYMPAAPHPLASLVRMAHEKLAKTEYDSQKSRLEEKTEPKEDIFVGTYFVFQAPSGAVRSLSMWTEGVLSLLPRTDSVMLQTLDDAGKATFRLEVPLDALGDLLHPEEGLRPLRYRTAGFPDGNTLRELQARFGGERQS